MSVAVIHLRVLTARARRGLLVAGNLRLPCALGRSGVSSRKREGDGATPRGCWRMAQLLVRSDRLRAFPTRLPRAVIGPQDGWCDDAGDRNYNRPVRLPYPASHERLWRQDRLYDAIVVLDYNLGARVRRRGSAIFLHVAGEGFPPTEGCIALARGDLRRLLACCSRQTGVKVW